MLIVKFVVAPVEDFVINWSFTVFQMTLQSWWCQYHQHFTNSYIAWKCYSKLFWIYSLTLYIVGKKLAWKILWWNRVHRTFSAFFFLKFFFWLKKILFISNNCFFKRWMKKIFLKQIKEIHQNNENIFFKPNWTFVTR